MSKKTFTRNSTGALVAAAVVTAGGLLITGVGVYAGLNAVATSTTDVASGTLSLTLGKDGNSAGFPQTVSNMAPGDVSNAYVTLTNGSSTNLAGKDITLAVAAPSSNPLVNPPTGDGGTVGLTVTVSSCSVAWTVTPGTPGSASCSGTGGATQILAPTAVASLSTAVSLISGAIAPAAVYHLQMTLTLPSNLNETTTNGTPPTQTIQGQSVTLNYTFGESQRTATVTNS